MQKSLGDHRQVLEFWFGRLEFADWFGQSDQLDAEIRELFVETHLHLSRGGYRTWASAPDTCLAAIIVLDQFPRNIYRGSPLAFATDGLALSLAESAVSAGFDRAVDIGHRLFFYLPFEHSERIADQDRAVEQIASLGNDVALDYAERHRGVIRRFGRFPHRNAILARASSPDELAYLAEAGAGF